MALVPGTFCVCRRQGTVNMYIYMPCRPIIFKGITRHSHNQGHDWRPDRKIGRKVGPVLMGRQSSSMPQEGSMFFKCFTRYDPFKYYKRWRTRSSVNLFSFSFSQLCRCWAVFHSIHIRYDHSHSFWSCTSFVHFRTPICRGSTWPSRSI